MITAVDTSVLLDLLWDDSPRGLTAAQALEAASAEGPLIISEVVYAELAPSFADRAALDRSLVAFGMEAPALGRDAAFVAGTMFASYRRSGSDRSRILPDFLIAAHALHHADRLLTRDRGFYRKHFPKLTVVQP
jgi:hypothetical protein